jgi:hypothetical protein
MRRLSERCCGELRKLSPQIDIDKIDNVALWWDHENKTHHRRASDQARRNELNKIGDQTNKLVALLRGIKPENHTLLKERGVDLGDLLQKSVDLQNIAWGLANDLDGADGRAELSPLTKLIMKVADILEGSGIEIDATQNGILTRAVGVITVEHGRKADPDKSTIRDALKHRTGD